MAAGKAGMAGMAAIGCNVSTFFEKTEKTLLKEFMTSQITNAHTDRYDYTVYMYIYNCTNIYIYSGVTPLRRLHSAPHFYNEILGFYDGVEGCCCRDQRGPQNQSSDCYCCLGDFHAFSLFSDFHLSSKYLHDHSWRQIFAVGERLKT